MGLLEPARDPERIVATLERFSELLIEEALPRGLLGRAEAPRVISRHVLESAGLVAFTDRDGRLIDVGSGAGLPGLPLAALWSDGEVVLIEPRARRAAFLRWAVRELDLSARVVQSTAEEAGRSDLRESARTAVARALAPPAVALELALPLVEIGGMLLLPTAEDGARDPLIGARGRRASAAGVRPDAGPRASGGEESSALAEGCVEGMDTGSVGEGTAPREAGSIGGGGGPGEEEASAVRPAEGPARGEERREAPAALGRVAQELGGHGADLRRFEVPGLDEARWVMIVRKVHTTPERYPRRSGVPRRRPLGGRVT